MAVTFSEPEFKTVSLPPDVRSRVRPRSGGVISRLTRQGKWQNAHSGNSSTAPGGRQPESGLGSNTMPTQGVQELRSGPEEGLW